MNNTNSKPQQIVDALLDKNNINYIKEKGITYYNVDNYLDNDLMIEVQGDYWHCNPNKFQTKITRQQFDRISRDKSKHTYIVNNFNKEPLYIWECDTYKRESLCEKLILEYIQNNGQLENYHSFNYYVDDKDELKLNNNITVPYQDQDVGMYKHLLEKIS